MGFSVIIPKRDIVTKTKKLKKIFQMKKQKDLEIKAKMQALEFWLDVYKRENQELKESIKWLRERMTYLEGEIPLRHE